MKRIFGDLKMSWLFVIIFSIIVGVYTGLIMLVPALKETSFQDIGISYECWVIFAVVIVVNCKKIGKQCLSVLFSFLSVNRLFIWFNFRDLISPLEMLSIII